MAYPTEFVTRRHGFFNYWYIKRSNVFSVSRNIRGQSYLQGGWWWKYTSEDNDNPDGEESEDEISILSKGDKGKCNKTSGQLPSELDESSKRHWSEE